jgi:hypothetical protein
MSTVTRKCSPAGEQLQWHHYAIHKAMAMCPVPCRTMYVEVYRHEKDSGVPYSVEWSPVVALLGTLAENYTKRVPKGAVPVACESHEEMIERGWEYGGSIYDRVLPVLAASAQHGEHSEPFRVPEPIKDTDNLAYRLVVPCCWPPEEDQANAVRIAKELIKRDGNYTHVAPITAKELNANQPTPSVLVDRSCS